MWSRLQLQVNDDNDHDGDNDDDDDDDEKQCTVAANVTFENPMTSTCRPIRSIHSILWFILPAH